MGSKAWGIDDPLLRGDDKAAVCLPVPQAPASIVRHVLFLEGPGRETPYLSTTEDDDVAARFAGRSGAIWWTSVAKVQAQSLRYISKGELLEVLRGKGKGDAAWPRASEVQTARAYVELWGEHLIDFRRLQASSPSEVGDVVCALFLKGSP